MEERSKIDDMLATLRTQRDELRLKLELGKAEAREEWDKLEKKWHEIEQKMESAGKEAKEVSKDVSHAVKVIADEVAEAYKRIKAQL